MAAVHLALAFAFLHVAWANPTASVAGPTIIDGPGYGADGIPNGDSLQLVWFTKWTPFALTHLHDPLYTTYLNAPAGANLMWDALMPVAGVVLAPITLLAGPSVGLNLLATVAVALCGVAATACARRFVRGWMGALAGGTAFQVSAFVVAQSQGHQSVVLAAAFVPCVILLVMDVLVSRLRSALAGGLLLGIAAAATFYTWEETLLSTALMTIAAAVVALAVAPRAALAVLRRGAVFVAVAALVAILLAAPGLLMQFFGAEHVPGGRLRDPNVWIIDLQNLVIPTASQVAAPPAAVAASHSWSGNSFEWGGYIGVPLLLIVVATIVVLWRRRAVRWLAVMLLIAVVLTLGPHLHVGGHDTRFRLPWAVLQHVPLVQDVLVSRLAVFPALGAALFLAVAVDALVASRRRVLAAAAVTAVAVSLLPSPLPAQASTSPEFFTSGAVTSIPAGSVALVAPYATPLAPQPMIWQAASHMRFRMPEGYVSLPSRTGGFAESPPDTTTSKTMIDVAAGQRVTVDDALRQAIRADLRRWGVRTVIVGPMPYRGAMVAAFTAVFGRPPSRLGGVEVWSNV